jgi:23S rRNA (guanosine2251-2'-O)-methyltransferase
MILSINMLLILIIGKKMRKTTFLIAGKHAVTEALRNPRRNVIKVFLTEDSKKTLNKDNENLNLFKKTKLFFKTAKELDRMCSKEQISHQNLIAEIEHVEQINLKEFLKSNENKKKITFAALEEVTDPRNIGSIIRSAVSFGIDGIIVKERSFPSESKLLYKSASGCMEHVNLFEVSNLSTTLKYLKTKNFWICGFDNNSKKDFTEHEWTEKNVLLFGSEGYGLKYQTIKNSDFILKININKKVESLNISNSAAVVFHFINK